MHTRALGQCSSCMTGRGAALRTATHLGHHTPARISGTSKAHVRCTRTHRVQAQDTWPIKSGAWMPQQRQGVLYLRNWMMCGCKSAEWFTISLRMHFWLRTTSRRPAAAGAGEGMHTPHTMHRSRMFTPNAYDKQDRDAVCPGSQERVARWHT